ncbi:MAG: Mono(2-hydroxyethyl) terephthalate hydrolase [Candidatus Ordinivivax streblomastigis]|uniref:Mono(2-hydroxyethyl) terephthalate hydrolase n=1 Tax=Candidatus Ordinivivax streblomastigis TaxID=2540710 RepID=A0A5M8NZN6_9BACT|nr:MAG: Mono(2-hydroxyethyl) terephthalate hydrolase [Candidatus Ordinivivax streblomastigis]
MKTRIIVAICVLLTTTLNAQTVERISAGRFTLPDGKAVSDLPAFQRVALVARPVPESNIRIEVWLPEENWNGRFLGTGNGGGAGSINYGVLIAGLKRGFAVANTDMGTSPDAHSVAASPEKWKDFGYRATHEMTVAAKKIMEEYYHRPPAYSYFIGCSTGGQQALMEAQRFPDDYDGIIAGAPANNRTNLHISFLWNYIQTNKEPGRQFTSEQLNRITDALLKINAGKDGGAPGDHFLTDPRMATSDCDCWDTLLTKQQQDALQKIYTGPVNPVTGETIYTAFPVGSENEGSGLLTHQNLSSVRGLLYPFEWAFGTDYDFLSFDFNKDVERMDSLLAPILNANNPDLEPFRKRGGKLLMYTGTSDALVPFQDAADYYERVIAAQGSVEKAQSFFRYFLVPGMSHCGGGQGVNDFGQHLSSNTPQDEEHDILTALMHWVEKEKAPAKIIASAYLDGNPDKGVRLRRTLFPYIPARRNVGVTPSGG